LARKRAPALLGLVDDIPKRRLTAQEVFLLCDLIMDEFLDVGRSVDDEPNASGIALERLIDEVRRHAAI
jgi:hypothetical protein